MQFETIYGQIKKVKKVTSYSIDWDVVSRSKLQTRVKEFIYPYWRYDVVFEEFPVVGTRLSLDFYNATKKIAIEVQGVQHTKFNKFFHGNNKFKYLDQLKRDDQKLNFCERNDIILAEIHEKQFDLKELLIVINP